MDMDYQICSLSENKKNELSELIKYVKKYNDFYNKAFDKVDENNFEINKLPVLKRESIREYRTEIISDNYDLESLIKETTYGTTEGIPLEIYKSKKEHLELGIILAKYRRALNKEYCKRQAYYYYNTDNIDAKIQMDCGNDYLNILFPVIKRNEKDYIDDLRLMNEQNVQWLICPPTVAYKLAEIAMKYEIIPHIKMIEFLSEFVPSFYREKIEKVFGCQTCIEYGCHETWGLAFSNNKNQLEVMDNVIIEKIKDDRFLNGYGKCIVTNLKLKAMPFIRYEIKDIINIHDNIVTTYGFRLTDVLKIGKIAIHCSFFSNTFECEFYEKILPLEDYQIVFVDNILYLCMHNSDLYRNSEIADFLSRKIQSVYGINIKINVKNVEKFYTHAFTGKMKGIINYTEEEARISGFIC